MKKILTFLTVTTLALGATSFAAEDPYTDKVDRFEMKAMSKTQGAGEVKTELSKDEPKVTFSKWNDEVRMAVKYDKVKGKGSKKLLSDKVEWKGNKEEVHAYPLEAKAGFEDGGFEIEIILNEKPNTNVFDFNIEGAENLDFFYQPALTAEEIAEGASRPENVIGSYAVYHKTKANHKVGETNYATGKAYHIYRPKAIDNNGVETWAELSYQNSTLSVTVPQSFLDDAEYPVIVDPTFGFTDIGATQNLSVLAGDPLLCIYALTENGDVTKLTIYTKSSSGTINTKGLIYDDDGASAYPGTLKGISDVFAPDTTFGWDDFTFSSAVTLTTGNWWIGFVPESTSVFEAFDTGTSNQQRYLTASQYTTPSDPFTAGATGSNRKVSIYATYTIGAAPATPEAATSTVHINNGTVKINNGSLIQR